MPAWLLNERDLKKYPHFDPLISVADGQALATNPDRVAKHKFYPFMLYVQRWNRFSKKGEKGKQKERPIRYAARGDAYIFANYRHILSELYEAELARLGLTQSILAYRRVPNEKGAGGKCNIHFARDAFQKIKSLGDCCVIALDISGFFENLDHILLKNLWCRLLGEAKLPPDHFQVFKAITQYAVVDKQKVYERLGHFGQKSLTKPGEPIKGYLTSYRNMPKQLCTGAEFRQKIAGGSAGQSIIQKNVLPYGIPQGAPISDLLANLYLIDFDRDIKEWAEALGGEYLRYSDDILILVPGDEAVGRSLMKRARDHIRNFGSRLTIKEEKSSLFTFRKVDNEQRFTLILGNQGRNGLEYLGFRYDGRRVYIRDATLSNLRRKVARAARRDANIIARRYPDKNASALRDLFDYERLIARFGRVEDFGEKSDDYKSWTFWTYATRSAKIFGKEGTSIVRQLRRHRELIRIRADKELDRAVTSRNKRKTK